MSFLAALAPIAGAVVGGLFNSKSNNKAADASVQSNRAAIESQERMFDRAVQLQEPWRQSGIGALNQQNALLGLNPTAALNTPGGGGGNAVNPNALAPPANQWGAYLQANPDVAQAYSAQTAPGFKQKFKTPEQFAQWHYQTYGQREGRPTGAQNQAQGNSGVYTGGGRDLTGTPGDPNSPAGQDMQQTLMDRQDEAYDLFNNSGFAKSMLETTQADMENMLGSYAAGGKAMAGSTLGALNDRNQRNKNAAFGQYYNALSGMSGTGANISSGMAGDALNTGRGIAADQRAIGNTRASSYANQGQRWGNVFGNALGSVDFGKLFG